MKAYFFCIFFSILLTSCYNEEVELFEIAFEEEVDINYYLFYNSNSCEGGIPSATDPKSTYWTNMHLSVIKRENDSQIEIYENGNFFLYGNITFEDDDNLFFSIPYQDIYFNDRFFEIEGYDDLCEESFIQGNIKKHSNSIVFSILFYGSIEGQPENIIFKQLAEFSSVNYRYNL